MLPLDAERENGLFVATRQGPREARVQLGLGGVFFH